MAIKHHEQPDRETENEENWWRSPQGILAIIFISIIGFYLVTEHWVHLMGVLPLLLILACPLMHILMHRNHHDHK